MILIKSNLAPNDLLSLVKNLMKECYKFKSVHTTFFNEKILVRTCLFSDKKFTAFITVKIS